MIPQHLKKLAESLDKGYIYDSYHNKPGRLMTNHERINLGKLIGADYYRKTSGKIRKI